MISSPYLFETVMTKMLDSIKPMLFQEIGKRTESIRDENLQIDFALIFQSFPRDLSIYSSIISTLSDIAQYDVPNVLEYLSQLIEVILGNKIPKVFATVSTQVLPMMSFKGSSLKEFMKYFQLLMLSDLICTIIYKHGLPENPVKLIRRGLTLCSSQLSLPRLTEIILSQWSVIFSKISVVCPDILFEQITNVIVNKADFFFILMRFVKLDSPNCPSENFIEIMAAKITKKKKISITSSMLLSLSTFLMTYQGDIENLKFFLDTAMPLCKNPDFPGAVDLVTMLIIKMGWEREQIKEFYEQYVFPLAKTKAGLPTAARSLRRLIMGNKLNCNWFFWVWGPKQRPNELQYLSWVGNEDYVSIFMEHYADSDYYGECMNEMRDILVHLAAIDFSRFIKVIFKKFVTSESIHTDRFMAFLTIIPLLNDPQFITYSTGNVTADDVRSFNQELGRVTGKELLDATNNLKDYGITPEQHEDYRYGIESATQKVARILNEQWKIVSGDQVESIITIDSKPLTQTSIKSVHIVKIIPFIMNSNFFRMDKLIKRIIKLAALSDTSISKPAYQICFGSMRIESRRNQLVETIVKMINYTQKEPIMFVCLSLLKGGIEELEPEQPQDEEAIEYNIEFAAYLALASENSLIRIHGWKLLERVNKLLQNRGFYAQAFDQIQAIESNVKHNILLQQFPKHVGHNKFSDLDLKFEDALASRYHVHWCFFLSELGKVISASNYTPLLRRIQKLAKVLKKKSSRKTTPHLHYGLLVMLLSTCICPENIDDSIYIYVTNDPYSTEKIPSFEKYMKKIIKKGQNESSKQILFQALQHSHYSLVPMILENAQVSLEFLPTLYMLIKSIEGNTKLRAQCFKLLQLYISQIMQEFVFRKANIIAFSPQAPTILHPSGLDQNQFNKWEIIILSFLCSIIIWLESDNCIIEIADLPIVLKFNLLTFVTNWANLPYNKSYTRCEKIRSYAAQALIPIISTGPIFEKNIFPQGIDDFVRVLSQCEKIGAHVLKPLLVRNKKCFIQIYINNCFRRKALISDVFFDAIYGSLPEDYDNDPQEEKEEEIFFNESGSLFLLALLRLKTGSLLAKPFLQKFILFYAHYIHFKEPITQEELSGPDISLIPSRYFIRVAEPLVLAGLTQMKHKKFKGTIKAMVDILEPWIRHFRILPNSDACVPNINTVYPRLSPKTFMNELLANMSIKKRERDFDRLVELWSILLEEQDHSDIVLLFITEYKDPEIKRMLFDALLNRFTSIISNRLALRCKFSFYAYIVYQHNSKIEQELWMIPIITKAFKHHYDVIKNHLPCIIHFALLFHSNQAQSLLKRLCKILNISYSRRTLSTGSIQRIVSEFCKKLVTLGIEDDPNTTWALEAMRWVLGSRNLKLASTSLIILNQIEYSAEPEQITDLLKGACKSTAYFLGQIDSSDFNTFEFINETFKLFKKHFKGNEEFCFQYLHCYLDFVVHVDAYFEDMLSLYDDCLNSPITRNEALNSLLAVLRPTFNELESDSNARDKFEAFADNLDLIDLQFVRSALLRSNDRNISLDQEMVEKADFNALNRVLGHYSLMVGTASSDLKRRIFMISSMILNKFSSEVQRAMAAKISQRSSRVSNAEPTSIKKISDPSPNSEEQLVESVKTAQEEACILCIEEAAKIDINKQDIVVIFRAAISHLPKMQEALQFVKDISILDPLIPTIPIIVDMNWNEAATTVITELEKMGKHENDVVTLTDCQHLGSTSNLLNITNKPKILPFTTQHDMMMNLNHETSKRGGLRIEKWMRTISSFGLEFHKKMTDRVSPNPSFKPGRYEAIPLPDELVPDNRMKKQNDPKAEICVSTEEFRKLMLLD